MAPVSAMRHPKFRTFSALVPLIALLFIQFAVRAHNITAQEPHMDEGFHAQRGAIVWHFQVNPGQISDGKLLYYYWVGLFEAERSTALFSVRTATALFSLIIGAMLYMLGRRFHSPGVGLLALGLYIFLPFAVDR